MGLDLFGRNPGQPIDNETVEHIEKMEAATDRSYQRAKCRCGHMRKQHKNAATYQGDHKCDIPGCGCQAFTEKRRYE